MSILQTSSIHGQFQAGRGLERYKMLWDMDDKDLAIIAIALLVMWSIFWLRVDAKDLVPMAITGIAGLAVGRKIPK